MSPEWPAVVWAGSRTRSCWSTREAETSEPVRAALRRTTSRRRRPAGKREALREGRGTWNLRLLGVLCHPTRCGGGDAVIRILPLTGELPGKLAAGIRAADLGCGTGHGLNLLAAAYPRSAFTGYDIATDAIEQARAEARSMGLANVTFEVRDVSSLPESLELDALFVFDAIHDQADPAGVLRSAYTALTPGGTFVVYDIKASSHVENNIANPLAPYMYSLSTLHCMTVSLSRDGAGLGTCWGEGLARQMLTEARFEVVSVSDMPDDPLDLVYVCRKSSDEVSAPHGR